MSNLKSTLVNNSKQNLERACEGCGWIIILTSSQDGTDISREYFMDALRW